MELNLITSTFQYWITTDWYIALLMSFGVNCAVYAFTAFLINSITYRLNSKKQIGRFIDDEALKPNQVRTEIKYGVVA